MRAARRVRRRREHMRVVVSDDVFSDDFRDKEKGKKERPKTKRTLRRESFLFSTRTLRSTLRLQRYGFSSVTTLIGINNDNNNIIIVVVVVVVVVVVLIDRPTLRYPFPVSEPAKKRAFVNSPKGSSSPPIRERIGSPITSSRTRPARFFRCLGDRLHYRLASGRYRSRNRLALSGTSNRSRR